MSESHISRLQTQLFGASDKCLVMGILNVTPDSFSDGGQFYTIDQALRQVEHMVSCGADIIDIGGESTRPGAQPVNAQEEIERVIPVLEAVLSRFDVPVSVDTSKSEVMIQAIRGGAAIINDVRAFTQGGALDAVAGAQVLLCAMHMQGSPGNMQDAPGYSDVVSEVADYLSTRAAALMQQGVARNRIIIDPGFGFGKLLAHNLDLMGHLSDFRRLDFPLLVGVSRKSMIGGILGNDINDRLIGSVALAMLAAQNGANILRVHDVKETVEALRVLESVKGRKHDNKT